MKILVVTQARTGSTRLPNKVLKTINGKTLLDIHLARIKKSKLVTNIIVATTNKEEDDAIEKEAIRNGVDFFRGSENDVLDRFYKSVKDEKPDYVVRLTSDCPLIDPNLLDSVIQTAIEKKIDYCSNVLEETFPDGQDIEILTFNALKVAWKNAKIISEREHVTPYIRKNSSFFNKNKFTSFNYASDSLEYKDVRMTVDEPKDFEVIDLLIKTLGVNKTWKEYADFYVKSDQISSLNSSIIRNSGYIKSIKED